MAEIAKRLYYFNTRGIDIHLGVHARLFHDTLKKPLLFTFSHLPFLFFSLLSFFPITFTCLRNEKIPQAKHGVLGFALGLCRSRPSLRRSWQFHAGACRIKFARVCMKRLKSEQGAPGGGLYLIGKIRAEEMGYLWRNARFKRAAADKRRRYRWPAVQTWKTSHVKAIYFYGMNKRRRRGRAQDISSVAHGCT